VRRPAARCSTATPPAALPHPAANDSATSHPRPSRPVPSCRRRGCHGPGCRVRDCPVLSRSVGRLAETVLASASPIRPGPRRDALLRTDRGRDAAVPTGLWQVGWDGTDPGWFARSDCGGRGLPAGGRSSRRRTSCSEVVRAVLRRAGSRRGTRAGVPCSLSTTWATGHPRRDALVGRRAGRCQPVRVPGVGSSCPTSKLLMTSLGVAVNVVLPALFGVPNPRPVGLVPPRGLHAATRHDLRSRRPRLTTPAGRRLQARAP
jgi:hypothetical protein